MLLVLGCVLGPTRAQILLVTLKTTNSCLVGGHWGCSAGKEKVWWERAYLVGEGIYLAALGRGIPYSVESKRAELEHIFSSNWRRHF